MDPKSFSCEFVILPGIRNEFVKSCVFQEIIMMRFRKTFSTNPTSIILFSKLLIKKH